ncbi:MAG: hypothetical protein ACRDT6_12395 [Micromonosporaceae bacterium]
MGTAWENYRRRAGVLRQVLARLDDTPGASVRWYDVPGVTEVFADREDLLRELHRVWANRLAARVDLALESDHHELAHSVMRAWQEVAAELPALRRVLDHHAGDPAIWYATRREHRMLAVAAGLAILDDPEDHAVAEGVRLVNSVTLPAPRPHRARVFGRPLRLRPNPAA